MKDALLRSLLELGHATSQNLEFSHRPDVHISYGEETITETNLLELRRLNSQIIHLHTFSKKKESQNGADWEWRLIGNNWTFQMRVQAKRLQSDKRLKISHAVGAAKNQQIDLLIANAHKFKMKPVYCLYSPEDQRTFWTRNKGGPAKPSWSPFEAGCLLVGAYKVKAKDPKSLADIEKDCVPWHYLIEPKQYVRSGSRTMHLTIDKDTMALLLADELFPFLEPKDGGSHTPGEFPTLDELNSDQPIGREIDGLVKTELGIGRLAPSADYYREHDVSKVLEIDVRTPLPEAPTIRGD